MNDYSALSDAELCAFSRAGDEQAENALILRYRRIVRSCTRPFFLAGGDSEDLVQEGMIGLLSAIREYDPAAGASFQTYAELCIRRRLISAARSASRLKHAPLNDGVSLDEILSDESQRVPLFSAGRFDRSPEDRLLEQEQARDVSLLYSRSLSKLETEILRYYLDGFSYAEISERCGRSPKSVDNAIQRIRRKLARHPELASAGSKPGDFSL